MNARDKKKVETYIATYKLTEHHSQKGAFMGEIYTTPEKVEVDPVKYEGGTRAVTNSVYYLLLEKGITNFNNLKSPKNWHYCDGSPQFVCLIDPKSKTCEELILGDPVAHKELAEKQGKPIVQNLPILPHQWVSAKLCDQNSFSLMTCTVTPGFDLRDFRMIETNEAQRMFPYFRNQIAAFHGKTSTPRFGFAGGKTLALQEVTEAPRSKL